jgi:hypothetical protein
MPRRARPGNVEAAAAVAVEQRAEHARRVEIRQAEPVDRPVVGDERDRAPVADRAVVTDRRVAVDSRTLMHDSLARADPALRNTARALL